jgi:MATE family multidrug resistance protein
VNKTILRLAIPNIISNLSIPLLGAVDTAMMGHMDGVEYLGAIALGGMIFNFVYWGFGFLRMGTTGLTAQAFGEDKIKLPKYVFFRAAIVALIAAAALLATQNLIEQFAFYMVNSSKEIEELGKSYFYIRIYAAPATLLLYAFMGFFLGMQNAKFPLYLAIASNILNIAFNVLFVFGFGLASDGVAYGTVCAQYFALFVAIFMMLRKYPEHTRGLSRALLLKGDELRKFFSVNSDIFIRTLCLIFTFSSFTAISAEFGDNILAVNTILLQFWSILAYGVDGFAFAAEALVGKFFGAKDKANLRLAIKGIFQWAYAMAIFTSLVFWLWHEQFLGLFTNQESLVSLAKNFVFWTIAAPIVNTACFIWDGVYIGATTTKPMRNTMILASASYFAAYYFTVDSLGNHSLWLGMTAFMLSRGALLTLRAKSAIFAKL